MRACGCIDYMESSKQIPEAAARPTTAKENFQHPIFPKDHSGFHDNYEGEFCFLAGILSTTD